MLLTELEKKVLSNLGDNEYIYSPDEVSWAFCALNDLDPKSGRGALGSLIKKGLAIVQKDIEEDIAWLTEEGIKAFKEIKN